MRRQVWPGALDQHRHFVSDQAGVGARGAEHSQATAMTCRGDEKECLFQLDNGLPYLTDAEMLPRTPGQALHASGQRGQMLSVLAAQAPG